MLYWRCACKRPRNLDDTSCPCGKRRPERPVIWCRFCVYGTTIRRSTGEVDRRRAARVERSMRAEAESRRAPRRGPRDRTLADLGALDIERSRGLGEQRAKTITEIWRTLLRRLGDPQAHKLAADHVRQYVTQRRGEGIRGQTIRRELQALKRGLLLAGIDVPEPWPTARTDPRLRSDPKKAANAGKLHEPATIARWLGELDDEARDLALLVLLTGLRAEEARRVVPDWVRGAGEGAPVPAYLDLPGEATKTRRPRTVGLTQAALGIIRSRASAPGVPIFGDRDHKRTYRAAARRIGYAARITLRDLRHTHATLALQATGDATAVQAALGHTDLATTQLYLSSTQHRTTAAAGAVGALLEGVVVTPATSPRDDTASNQPERTDAAGLLSRGQQVRILPGAPNHAITAPISGDSLHPMRHFADGGGHPSVVTPREAALAAVRAAKRGDRDATIGELWRLAEALQ